MLNETQDYAYIEIDANEFARDANIEFGASKERSKSQFRIILGGWNGEKSRIAAYDSSTETDSQKVTQEHSKNQWKSIRLIVLCDIRKIGHNTLFDFSIEFSFGSCILKEVNLDQLRK